MEPGNDRNRLDSLRVVGYVVIDKQVIARYSRKQGRSDPMFDIYCPTHDSRVLLWTADIDSVENTEHGIVVSYHCTCGHRGTWVTGSRAGELATAS
jgi:hypothetical protein